jgi:hypothetical protein
MLCLNRVLVLQHGYELLAKGERIKRMRIPFGYVYSALSYMARKLGKTR